MTKNAWSYSWEFKRQILDERTKTTGVIVCEQVKSLDILARNASFTEKAPGDILDEVVDILIGLVEKS